MSLCNDCQDTNPCEPKCNDCLPENPCYETGCLNPTTWDCINLPGNLESIDVINKMTGKEVLSAIANKISMLELDIAQLESPTGGSDAFTLKATSGDSTPAFLHSKLVEGRHMRKDILQAGGNEKVSLSVTPHTLISQDDDNILQIGQDNLLKVTSAESEGKIYAEGEGIKFSDSDGTTSDPIYISLENVAVQAQRACFDGEWKNLTLNSVNNSDISWVTGQPKYRIRFDGSVEFKGSVTYTVKFGAYQSSTREHSFLMGSLPQTCIAVDEMAGQSDLKSITYIDAMQPSGDLIAQQYNYIIRKANQNIRLVLQSSFSTETTKTVVVSFDGAVWHPDF